MEAFFINLMFTPQDKDENIVNIEETYYLIVI